MTTTTYSDNTAALHEMQEKWLLAHPKKQHPLVGSIVGTSLAVNSANVLRPVLINHVGLNDSGQLFYGYFTMVNKPNPENRRHAVQITGATPASYVGEHILARIQYGFIIGDDTQPHEFKVWGTVDNITLNRAKKLWTKTGKRMDNSAIARASQPARPANPGIAVPQDSPTS